MMSLSDVYWNHYPPQVFFPRQKVLTKASNGRNQLDLKCRVSYQSGSIKHIKGTNTHIHRRTHTHTHRHTQSHCRVTASEEEVKCVSEGVFPLPLNRELRVHLHKHVWFSGKKNQKKSECVCLVAAESTHGPFISLKQDPALTESIMGDFFHWMINC